jgi:hypothetical protein
MHVNHASHALLKIQYVHASNLGISVRYFKSVGMVQRRISEAQRWQIIGMQSLARRMSFATSPVLKQHWLLNTRLSTRTVRNGLKSAGLKSRRVINCPLLADRYPRSRLAWCLARRGWNLRTGLTIH